MTTNHMNQK